jgi:hypothetical protein
MAEAIQRLFPQVQLVYGPPLETSFYYDMLFPDGKIMSRKLIKSSGNKAWDEAVIKALDKTDTLPRDTDGSIPTMMVLGFKPRD